MGFDTGRQQEVFEAYTRLGSTSAAAMELGISVRAVQYHLKAVKEKAAGTVPPLIDPGPSMFVNKTTTEVKVNPDGSITPTRQWNKADKQKEEMFKAFEDAVANAASKMQAAYKPAPLKLESVSEDLLNVIPYGDLHVGMQAWGQESGVDWDLKKARRIILETTNEAVSLAPRAKYCIFSNLGDFWHNDNQKNVTPAHGHQLDVDSRWAKIFDVGTEIAVGIVERLLFASEEVVVDMTSGNHDPHMSVVLSYFLKAWFRNEPRVRVNMDPGLYHYHQFGVNMLAFHHGHRVKLEALPGIMAANQPVMWGNTVFRKCHTGHVHSSHSTEKNGAKAESYGVIPPRDAHAAGGGYTAERNLSVETWHRTRGPVNRVTVPVLE